MVSAGRGPEGQPAEDIPSASGGGAGAMCGDAKALHLNGWRCGAGPTCTPALVPSWAIEGISIAVQFRQQEPHAQSDRYRQNDPNRSKEHSSGQEAENHEHWMDSPGAAEHDRTDELVNREAQCNGIDQEPDDPAGPLGCVECDDADEYRGG